MKRYHLDKPSYPKKLRTLPNPPPVLTTSRPLEDRRAVAIVGSRDAVPDALEFAHELAFKLASAGLVVVSGGASGVDAAAHRGAMDAGGATWVVSPTGMDHLYPPAHRELFDEIARSERSRMIWPFPDDETWTRGSFLYRNGILAALSEVLVVVQARLQSGSRNAVLWARDLGRPVWAATSFPWEPAFRGSAEEIERGHARPLCSIGQLMRALGLGSPAARIRQLPLPYAKTGRARPAGRIPAGPPDPLPDPSWTDEEKVVVSELCTDPKHVDQIVEATGLTVPLAATALLTLALKDVVVEGPNGFFRRRTAP